MIELLRSLAPFSELDWQLLNTVASHAKVINLPAGRVLHQPGRILKGRYYLLRGRLRCQSPAGIVRAAKQTVYPGCSGIVCVSPVRLLHVDTDPIAFLFEAGAADDDLAAEADGWQIRFLRSHMLTGIPQPIWQRILRQLQPGEVQAGETIIREGDRGSCCFILARGRAEVRRGAEVLRHLAPGDFFGEDALLAGEPRNASVVMTEHGTVMSLGEASFRRWLADVLLAPEAVGPAPAAPVAPDPEADASWHDNQQTALLSVADAAGLRERLKEVDPCLRYRVVGASGAARLAVFLLRQRGVRAALGPPGADDQALTVRPSAQARKAVIDSPRITDMG